MIRSFLGDCNHNVQYEKQQGLPHHHVSYKVKQLSVEELGVLPSTRGNYFVGQIKHIRIGLYQTEIDLFSTARADILLAKKAPANKTCLVKGVPAIQKNIRPFITLDQRDICSVSIG